MAIRYLLLAVVAIVLYSCASQVAPTGGEKDITPPAVIRSSPENLSTHFHSKVIKITFDEWVQLNDPSAQIFFSPALSKNPRYRMHGKTLTITLPDSLQPGITYSVNFGSAIQDVNEKNILLSYRYVFSTGDYIDSLRIGGQVTEAITGLPAKNSLVMLYDELDDSVIVKQRPSYYSRTGDDGSFEIDYLKEGTYKMVALNDANFNLMYDLGEGLAFNDTLITVKDTSGIYQLALFQPVAETQKILSAHSTAPGKVVLAFAKPLQSFSVQYPGAAQQQAEVNAARDTAILWVNETGMDSIDLYVHDNSFADTVRVRMKMADPEKKILPPKFVLDNPFKKGKMASKQITSEPIIIYSSTPVISADENVKILMTEDSSKLQTEISFLLARNTDLGKTNIVLQPFLKANTAYTLLIPSNIFEDLFGRKNDSTLFHFSTFGEEETGNLIMKVNVDSALHCFYSFYNSEKQLIKEDALLPGMNELSFTKLPPGSYSFRVVADESKNGKWDSGNYWQHRQPEKIFNYSGDIRLRANWDLELEMNVGLPEAQK